MIRVEADFDAIARRLPNEETAKKIMARAINRALTAGRVAAAREAAKIYAISQSEINKRVLIRPTNVANLHKGATLQYTGRNLSVSHFKITPNKPNPAKRPVLRAMVKRANGARERKGAFLVPTRAGAGNIAFRRVGKDRYPLEVVYGASVPQMVSNKKVSDAVQGRINEVVVTRLEHEINRELGG